MVVVVIRVVPFFGVEFDFDLVDLVENFDEGFFDLLGLASDLANSFLGSGWEKGESV